MKTFKWGAGDPVPIKIFVVILIVSFIVPFLVIFSGVSILGVFIFLAFFPIYVICLYKIVTKFLKKDTEKPSEEDLNSMFSRMKPIILMCLLFLVCFLVYQWALSALAMGFRH